MQIALLHLVDMGVLPIDVARPFSIALCAACIFAMCLVRPIGGEMGGIKGWAQNVCRLTHFQE